MGRRLTNRPPEPFGAFGRQVWADPAAGVAGVLLTQLLPFGDPQVLETFAAFERAVYGA